MIAAHLSMGCERREPTTTEKKWNNVVFRYWIHFFLSWNDLLVLAALLNVQDDDVEQNTVALKKNMKFSILTPSKRLRCEQWKELTQMKAKPETKQLR